MYKKTDVSLVVTSKSMSLGDLATALGRPPKAGSHDKGTPHPSGNTWKMTIWREDSCDPNASLEVQGAHLLSDMPSACSDLLATRPDDIAVTLDVAEYFDTAYFSLIISPVLLSALADRGVGLEITAYPVEPDAA